MSLNASFFAALEALARAGDFCSLCHILESGAAIMDELERQRDEPPPARWVVIPMESDAYRLIE
jgi:hypothetical protein